MHIDLSIGQNKSPLSQQDMAKLTSQMAETLSKLKLPLAKPILFEVLETTKISQAERQALLKPDSVATLPKGVVELLNDPQSQLIKLAVRAKVIHVISSIALTQGHKIVIRATPEHFEAPTKLNPKLAPALTPSAPGQPQPSPIKMAPDSAQKLPLIKNAPLKQSSPPITEAKTAAIKVSVSPTPEPAVDLRKPTLTPSAPLTSRFDKTDSPLLGKAEPSTTRVPSQTHSTSLPAPSQAPQTSLVAKPSNPAVTIAEIHNTLNQQLRTKLPGSEPLGQVKLAGRPLLERLEALPAPTSEIKIQAPQIHKLWQALKELPQQAIKLPPNTPPATERLAQSIVKNGIFSENAPLQRPTPERADGADKSPLPDDTKTLLTRIETLINQLSNTTTTGASKQSFSSIEKLLMSFLGAQAPSQQPKSPQQEPGAPQFSLNTLKISTQKALEQIQLRQAQTLMTRHSDGPQATQTLLFDIPLRLPDAWINLFVALQEPRDKQTDQKSKRHKKQQQRRWKLYLSLELDNWGQLASELLVGENHVDATLWADNETLRNKAKLHLQTLKNQLKDRGLEVGELVLSDAPPPKRENYSPQSPLVDLET